jgi:hypothetical protein
MIALALLLSTLTGFLLVRSAWSGALRWEPADWFRLPAGALIGIGLSSIGSFLYSGHPAGPDLGLLVLAGVLFAVFGRGSQPGSPVTEAPAWRPALWLAMASVAVMAVAYWIMIGPNPHGDFDAWTIWNLRARFLFRGASLKTLADPVLAWARPEFPYLLTSSVVRVWRWAGSDTPTGPVWIAAWFAASLPMAVYGAVRVVRTHSQALIALAAVVGSAGFIGNAAVQLSDFPLAAYLFCALAAIVGAERLGQPSLVLIAGLCSGLAAWTKFEGLYYCGALVLVALWRCRVPGVVRFLAGALPGIGATVYFLLNVAPPSKAPPAYPLSLLVAILAKVFTFSFLGWVVTPFVVLAFYFFCVRRRKNTDALAIWIPAGLLFLSGCAAIITRDDNNGDSAAIRVIMHVWPCLLFALFQFANTPEDLMVENVPARKAKQKK